MHETDETVAVEDCTTVKPTNGGIDEFGERRRIPDS